MSVKEKMLKICELMGIHVEQDFQFRHLHGAYYSDAEIAAIMIAEKAPDKEHTLAHEIGHAFLTHCDMFTASRELQVEEEALVNRFADGLLKHLGREAR